MYRTILVPLDGSRFSEHALPAALSVARHAGAAIRLITVTAPLTIAGAEGISFSTGELEEELAARSRVYIDAIAARVSACGVTASWEVVTGEVGEILCAEAAKGASLVVMATHGRGTFERFWLGSVADEVVRNATIPVLLVRPGETEPDLNDCPRLSPVLACLDGTEHAEHVLDHAVALAALAPDGELVLLRAIGGVATGAGMPDTPEAQREARSLHSRLQEMQAQLRNEAGAYLERVAGPVRGRGIKARTLVVTDEQPARAILEAAKSIGAGLIALETHGRAGLSRFFLGSIADKVIRASSVPILVHRHAN